MIASQPYLTQSSEKSDEWHWPVDLTLYQPAPASRASSQQGESGEKEEAKTTDGSSEESEEHEKQGMLSVYHYWGQQGCVSFNKWQPDDAKR